MIRKFTNIQCICFDEKNYIPAKYSCPDLVIDDVLLDLSTNSAENYDKISKTIVDYAFALYCHNVDVTDFSVNPLRYRRENWKLLDFTDESIKDSDKVNTKKKANETSK